MVGDVRKAIKDLPDDAKVVVFIHNGALSVAEVYEQASDNVGAPWGTDPEHESTVGLLVLETFDEPDG